MTMGNSPYNHPDHNHNIVQRAKEIRARKRAEAGVSGHHDGDAPPTETELREAQTELASHPDFASVAFEPITVVPEPLPNKPAPLDVVNPDRR